MKLEEAYKDMIVENYNSYYYHGTNKIFKNFKSSGGDLGSGIYFTPNFVDAVSFAWQKKYKFGGKQQIIYKVKLNFKNPLDFDKDNKDIVVCIDFYKNNDGWKISKYARDNGYDAIIRNNVLDKGNEIVVFDNSQIEVVDILDYNMRSIK